jgi:RimJ/RimL family protein N-acetyltransferase
MTPDFDIRYSTPEDLEPLKEWFQEPGACDFFPFNDAEKEESLKNWIGFAKFKASLTGVLGNRPCAMGTLFLMPYRKVAHHCSFYLIVDPAHRRQGIGTSMVRNLLNLAKNRFRLESLHAEIYEGSPIHSILLKEGFEEVFRQENFLKQNGELKARIILEHFFK